MLNIDANTKITIFFDASGSMNTTLSPLVTMRDTLLQDLLLGYYGDDVATYNAQVTIVQPSNERTFRWLNNQGNALALKHIVLVFQDEADSVYTGGSQPTASFDTDMAALRATLASRSESDYQAIIFQVTGDSATPAFMGMLEDVMSGASPYDGAGDNLTDYTELVGVSYGVQEAQTPAYYAQLIQIALSSSGVNVPLPGGISNPVPSSPAAPDAISNPGAGAPPVPDGVSPTAPSTPAAPDDITPTSYSAPPPPDSLPEGGGGSPAAPGPVTPQSTPSPDSPVPVSIGTAPVPATPDGVSPETAPTPSAPQDVTPVVAGAPAPPVITMDALRQEFEELNDQNRVEFLPNVTGLTGGTINDLDGQPVDGLSIPRLYVIIIPGQPRLWRLRDIDGDVESEDDGIVTSDLDPTKIFEAV